MVRQQLRLEGFDIIHCTIATLIKVIGIQGTSRSKPHVTSIPDKKVPCPQDMMICGF